MRLNIAIPEAHVTKPVLDAALESVTRLNEQLLDGGAPTAKQLIQQGAQWRPEPPGQEHFDHAGILAHRGWGDCDDWAPLHAASLRKTGEDKGAKAVVHPSGPNTWHAVVERSNGKIDDPSKAAGMGTNGWGIHGACLPLMNAPQSNVSGMYIVRPSVAVRPTVHGFQGRVDLPWHSRVSAEDTPTPTDYAMTALETSPLPSQALVGAINGAIHLGMASGIADPEHLDRLAAIADACEGCPHHELVQKWGPQHAAAAANIVGSFFGNLMHAVTSPVTSAAHFLTHPSLANAAHMFTDPLSAAIHTAQPLAHLMQPMLQPLAHMASPLMRFIPGVGPIASSAVDYLAQGMPTDPRQLAQFAMREAPGFIPGLGPMLQNPLAQAAMNSWPQMFH